MSAKLPVVVVVPGCWSVPAMYRKLGAALESKSFKVHIPDLPTNNGVRPPNSSHEADVEAVRKVVEPLVNDGKEVIMLMHSYGGVVGTNAVQGLSRTDRQSGNLPGGVVHLLYLSAYVVAKGQSILKVIERSGRGEDVAAVLTIDEDGTGLPNDPVWAMYHDLDPKDQEEQNGLVVRNNMGCGAGEAVYEGWRDIPSTYIRTTEDRCVPVAFQDICIGDVTDAGVSINVVEFNCGHSAYVKCPEDVTDLVVKITSS